MKLLATWERLAYITPKQAIFPIHYLPTENATVDDKFYEQLLAYPLVCWTLIKQKRKQRTYVECVNKAGERVSLHRLVYELENGPPDDDCNITFANGNGMDCTINNIRALTDSQAARMRSKSTVDCTSKYTGVTQRGYRFQAYITSKEGTLNLGVWDDEIEAAYAYNTAAIELYGFHVKLNVIPPDALTTRQQTEIDIAVMRRFAN